MVKMHIKQSSNYFKRPYYCVVFFLLLSAFNLLWASNLETLPAWHWSYDYIEMLQNRGVFQELSAIEKPYTKGQVAEAILKTKQKTKLINALSEETLKMFQLMEREFKSELKEIGQNENDQNINLGLYLQPELDNSEEETEFKGFYRGRANVRISSALTLHSAILFDRYAIDDPLYVGKEWRDMTAYNEQAYLKFLKGPFSFKFGRDYLEWGANQKGSLFMSDVSRPLDQMQGSLFIGPFKYTFLTTFLDKVPDSLETDRYFSAHRLVGNFFQNKLQVSITEAVLYGGRNRPVDYVYLNPTLIYYDAELNRSVKDNKFLNFEVAGYPASNLFTYANFLIDDIQIEKTGPGDLEPNEIGMIFGFKWADPFKCNNLTVSGEYAKVTNRTYKTAYPWETFVFQNHPLGHPLGNDFDLWFVELSKWWLGNLNVKVNYQAIRKGQGSIYTPWDSPWMEYTVEEGYSEPFPTGIVENRNILGVEFKYYPSIHWGLQGFVRFRNRKNAGHVEGMNDDKTLWRVGFWWQGEVEIVTSD